MSILIAFIIVSVLGLLLGLGLAIAEKRLSVEQDKKLAELIENMPGANCGGCGFAGCSSYAEAVYTGKAEAGLCSPGGDALAKKMAEILGIEVKVKERMVAFIHCSGSLSATKIDYEYKGIEDCNAAALLEGGPMGCKEGCLHLGSCIAVCPVGAISRDEDGRVTVDREKCIGCGKCTTVCPNGVVKLVPYSASYIVACNNHLPGGKVKKICESGCIGCKICQLKVENSPFIVENFLSGNDYSKDQTSADKAMELCPQKSIKKV